MVRMNDIIDNYGSLLALVVVFIGISGLIIISEYRVDQLNASTPKFDTITLLKAEYVTDGGAICDTIEVYGTNSGEHYTHMVCDSIPLMERELWITKFITLEKGKRYNVSYKKLDSEPQMTKQMVDIEEI